MKDRNIDIEDVSICLNYDREHKLLPAVLNGRKERNRLKRKRELSRRLSHGTCFYLLKCSTCHSSVKCFQDLEKKQVNEL